MSLREMSADARLPIRKSLRHLIVFQFKLLADALRDLLLSPLSIIVFLIDALVRPEVAKSLTVKLMMAGRHSDRIINLFDEYSNKDKHFTLDDGVDEFETIVQNRIKQRRARQQEQTN